MRTKFLPPIAVRIVLQEIERLAEVTATPFGGYPYAERCRILIMREELKQTHDHNIESISEVVPVQITGNFLMVKAEHSDFLGSLTRIGLKSEDIGDIIIQKDIGCLTFTAPETVQIMQRKLQTVRSVDVKTEKIDYDAMTIPEPRIKNMTIVEHSMRLDAVASAAFGIAREKMADRIKDGEVTLNWQPVDKPDIWLKEGSIISCRDKGRAEIKRVVLTKKMKYNVELTRIAQP